MASVGFSTGGLYTTGLPLDKRIKMYLSSGADAIELSFLTADELFQAKLSKETIVNIKKFKYISIHAPGKNIRYNKDSAKAIINKLQEICSQIPVNGIVLHPDVVDDFQVLEKSNLPFLIENMDKRKTSGTDVKYFEELKKKYNFGFVLDLQHVYEHDKSMKLAEQFIKIMGNRLKHMHVSGCTESDIHAPTHSSSNREAITKILKKSIDVPKILEGNLTGNTEEIMGKELAYIRKYEKKD